MVNDPLAEVLDWVAIHCPGPIRTELVAALGAATSEDGGAPTPMDYWRTLAEQLVAKGHMDLAREALKRWQLTAPADHPVHALLGGPPPEAARPEPPPRPVPPIPKREEPTSRLVKVIDTTYTFKRLEPQMEKVQGKKVTASWETYLEDSDDTSRAVINAYEDGTYGPWAVTGVFSDFAGAAAVEVVVRTMQRHFYFTFKKTDKTRKTLTNIVLPATAVLGVLAGYVMAVLH